MEKFGKLVHTAYFSLVGSTTTIYIYIGSEIICKLARHIYNVYARVLYMYDITSKKGDISRTPPPFVSERVERLVQNPSPIRVMSHPAALATIASLPRQTTVTRTWDNKKRRSETTPAKRLPSRSEREEW